MRPKPLLNILGALLSILCMTMVVPIFISYGYGESDLNGFLYSALICISIGLPVWIMTRHRRPLTNRDGFAIVTFSWIITAVAGALPFYFSGAIPNITDAFFESMSGVTTTGASIIGNTDTLPNLPNGIESLPHGILFWRSFIQIKTRHHFISTTHYTTALTISTNKIELARFHPSNWISIHFLCAFEQKIADILWI